MSFGARTELGVGDDIEFSRLHVFPWMGLFKYRYSVGGKPGTSPSSHSDSFFTISNPIMRPSAIFGDSRSGLVDIIGEDGTCATNSGISFVRDSASIINTPTLGFDSELIGSIAIAAPLICGFG